MHADVSCFDLSTDDCGQESNMIAWLAMASCWSQNPCLGTQLIRQSTAATGQAVYCVPVLGKGCWQMHASMQLTKRDVVQLGSGKARVKYLIHLGYTSD